MNDSKSVPSLAVLRMIVTAMVMGACVIGGTVIFSASRIGGKVIASPAVGYAVAALALAALLAAFVFLPNAWRKPVPEAPESDHLKSFGMLTLLRMGILEGVLMLAFIMYLLTQDEIVLGSGIILTLGIILIRPSDESYRRWVNL